MTTFKRGGQYLPVLFGWLEASSVVPHLLRPTSVLSACRAVLKGGDLEAVASSTRLRPQTSGAVFPSGTTQELASGWGQSKDALALEEVVRNRLAQRPMRGRNLASRVGSWLVATAPPAVARPNAHLALQLGLSGVYRLARQEVLSSVVPPVDLGWFRDFARELMLGGSIVSRQYPPAVDERFNRAWEAVDRPLVRRLFVLYRQLKEIMRAMSAARLRSAVQELGREGLTFPLGDQCQRLMRAPLVRACERWPFGSSELRVTWALAVWGDGYDRVVLGRDDVNRLHTLLLSSLSALVATAYQTAEGSAASAASRAHAIVVAERQLTRILDATARVQLGDEVLVCKAFKRAFGAYQGYVAGSECAKETQELVAEAEQTAAPGVCDVAGYIADLRGLQVADAHNAGKMYKVCPMPDASPGAGMLDRVRQIGNTNPVAPGAMDRFRTEFRAQMLRAHIRTPGVRLTLRDPTNPPAWWGAYRARRFADVPSAELDRHLAWEGTARMPTIDPSDPKHWKDSGLGADTLEQAMSDSMPRHLGNMLLRFLYDPTVSMPGHTRIGATALICMLFKPEGHKDPVRAIYSAALETRQAQSLLELAVDAVARHHPSFMIGKSAYERRQTIRALLSPVAILGMAIRYFSYDIKGWSPYMPPEPQRVSHEELGALYNEPAFAQAHHINEGAVIYLNRQGYKAWYRNTGANLEGFNGKQMTMVMLALMSCAVRRFRREAVASGVLSQAEADATSVMLLAYIDDGLTKADLPILRASAVFEVFKKAVVDEFLEMGYAVEVAKSYPSAIFAIFLNEPYVAGRHVAHGVKAAMTICSEVSEAHTSLVERANSVFAGLRGAVMAGLTPFSAYGVGALHLGLHYEEWVGRTDPVAAAVWTLAPRGWGGLGMPNWLQLVTAGSGAAQEESIATLQAWARCNTAVTQYFLTMCKTPLKQRGPLAMLLSPMSAAVADGYMVDSRVSTAMREALTEQLRAGKLAPAARKLVATQSREALEAYANAVVLVGDGNVYQEQMLDDLMRAHPVRVFEAFAARLEKTETLRHIIGQDKVGAIIRANQREAKASYTTLMARMKVPYRSYVG